MEELELTFLAKELPANLNNSSFKEIIDLYIPKSLDHPKIRIRKNGEKYEITKKELLKDDPSHMLEQTISITAEEFDALQSLPGKKVHKIRYYYKYQNLVAEFDIFQENLLGLVVIDFEFDTLDQKANFKMPDFCLADVTREEFIAGGMICGKKIEDIESALDKFNYKKLFL